MGKRNKPQQEKKEKEAPPPTAGKPAKCLTCGVEFASKRKLFDHLRTEGTECHRVATAGGLAPAPKARHRPILLSPQHLPLAPDATPRTPKAYDHVHTMRVDDAIYSYTVHAKVARCSLWKARRLYVDRLALLVTTCVCQ